MSTVIYPDIAIIGKAGAGKTTAAEILRKKYDYERLSFAAPLKVMCGTETDRDLLQCVGVRVRELVTAGWVNLLRHDLEQFQSLHRDPWVVDDGRFPNEMQMLLEEGFRIVRVVAGRNDRVVRLRANGKLTDEAQLEHVSETSLDAFEPHYTIVNSGTPQQLEQQLVEVIDKEAR